MPYYTPLRYPGGKSKLAPFVQKIFKDNDLMDGTYVEPYAGGAGVAFSLLLEGFARYVIINDIDYLIYAFWKSILDNTDDFCQKVYDTPVNLDVWEQQKAIHRDSNLYSLFDVGFATFFLNRTNRSGIMNGGMIGGRKQEGTYKIDARYNKKDLIQRICLIAQYRNRISVYNEDAMNLLAALNIRTGNKVLFYFDPPYYNKGQLLYKNSYEASDHAMIASIVQKIKTPWIVTYDDVPAIEELYKDSPSFRFSLNYSASKNVTKGKEIMFFNNITVPAVVV